MSMQDNELNILLVDDRLACLGTAKFLEHELNLRSESGKYNFRVTPERFIEVDPKSRTIFP